MSIRSDDSCNSSDSDIQDDPDYNMIDFKSYSDDDWKKFFKETPIEIFSQLTPENFIICADAYPEYFQNYCAIEIISRSKYYKELCSLITTDYRYYYSLSDIYYKVLFNDVKKCFQRGPTSAETYTIRHFLNAGYIFLEETGWFFNDVTYLAETIVERSIE